MKKVTSNLLIILLVCIIVTLIGYNRLVIYKESQKLQELNLQYQEETTKVTPSSQIVINCIGDSLTLGDNKTAFPAALASLTNLSVNKFGGATDQSIDLSIRLGRTKVYVNDITIPASVKPVNIQLYDKDGDILDVLKNNGSNFTSVEINGISGQLKYDKDNLTHTFTRDQAGKEVEIHKLTQVLSQLPEFKKDDIAIIFTGTYDPTTPNGIFKTITYQRSIIKQLQTKKYIVISLTSKRRMPIVDDMNKVLANEHKEHFLDFRSYLFNQGIKDSKIKLTKQDRLDLDKKYIPSSLLKGDGLNGNAKFNDLLAKQIIEKLIELKYIDKSSIQ